MSTGSEAWLARRRAAPPASPAGAHLVHPCQLWSLHTCRSLWQSEAGPGSLTQTAGTGLRGPRAGSLLAVERWHQGPGGLPMQPSGLSNGPSACSTAGPSGQGPVLSLPSHPLRAGAGAGVGAEMGESRGAASWHWPRLHLWRRLWSSRGPSVGAPYRGRCSWPGA